MGEEVREYEKGVEGAGNPPGRKPNERELVGRSHSVLATIQTVGFEGRIGLITKKCNDLNR